MKDTKVFRYNSGCIFKILFREYNSRLPRHEKQIEIKEFLYPKDTGLFIMDKYISNNHKWKFDYNEIYSKYIIHTPYLNQVYNIIYSNQLEKYKNIPKIGLLIRNNNLSREQPSGEMPSIGKYISAIESLNIDKFILICAIDNLENLNFFKKNYNIIYNPFIKRSDTANDIEPHHIENMQAIDGAYHYLESFILSKADYFIHPVSNMATSVLYINPKIKNIFLY